MRAHITLTLGFRSHFLPLPLFAFRDPLTAQVSCTTNLHLNAMTASETAAHLNYLTDAAHLLPFTAPETSSYLMTQRNGLLFANELEQSATQRQHVCGACGCIMIPGQNSTLKLENEKALRSKNKRDTSATGKVRPGPRKQDWRAGPSKVFTCERCGRYTRVGLPPPGPISRKNPSAAVTKAVEMASLPPPSANASSKKRAKNRKAGLQALLNQSQAGGSGARTGLGLSLSDFEEMTRCEASRRLQTLSGPGDKIRN